VDELELSGFASLNLNEPLLASLAALGYEEPTPIQRAAIPPLLEGRDLLGQAATGTGKTAAFALPLLQRITRDKLTRALVLVPTRELAMQVAEAVQRYGKGMATSVLAIYGGAGMYPQIKALERGVSVVVATPGRALDHLRRGTLKLDNIEVLVLDEADEMLDMGFAEDLELLLKSTPATRQTALFSATLPPRIVAITGKHLREPVRVAIAREPIAAGALPKVRQVAYLVMRAYKPAALGRLLDMESPTSAIVFCRTRTEVDELTERLNGRGYRAEPLHGGLSQEQRDRVMKRFRSGVTTLLIATDVAARGLDIEHVSHVVNYDVPAAPEAYVHRIGRTGRAQCVGDAISFVTNEDHGELRALERFIGRGIVRKKAEGFNYSQSAPPFNPDEDRRPRTPRPPPRQGGRPSGPPRSQGGGGGGQHRSSQGGQAPRPPQGGGRQQGGRPQFSSSHAPRPPRDDGGRREEPNGNREGGNLRHFPSTAPRQGGFRRRFGPR
jgi:ATP-dependent RNA helicase DeaD